MRNDDETRYITVKFEFDLRTLEGNPFFLETPFGRPIQIGLGDIFQERDDLEERVRELETLL